MQLRAEGMTKEFGGTRALDQLSWTAEPGQIIALLGANGAGKTTLLHALAGTILLDGGQVLIDGEVFTADRRDLRQRIAFLPDVPPIPGNWSPLRFIGSALQLYGAHRDGVEDLVLQILEDLDLVGVATWRFSQLSRGQIYKSVLAGFLAADPELWLLDEPYASGMDPRGLKCFQEYAWKSVSRGRTIIFSTQIVEVAEGIADRICVMDQGKIVADAAASEIRNAPGFSSLMRQLSDPVR
jgi:ABC-type multidrug transport system ATPase subunit